MPSSSGGCSTTSPTPRPLGGCSARRRGSRATKVILSFHHPCSFTYAAKVVRRELFGFQQGGRGITHWRLRREAAQSGLCLVETRSFLKFASINWFACLHKATASAHSNSS
jgi:hypothetical protein